MSILKRNRIIAGCTALIAAIAVASCGDNVKSMEYGELQQLSGAEREEHLKTLSDEEKGAMIAAGMKYAFSGDTAAFRNKTVGELIEEGKEIVQRIKDRKEP